MKQTEVIRECEQLVNHHLQRLDDDLTGLNEAALNIRPNTGWWSVGQIGEHLLVTHRLYFDGIEKALADCPARQTESQEFKPTRMGGLLASKVGPGTNIPAPRMFWPSEHPPLNVMDQVKTDLIRLKAMVEKAKELDLNAAKLPIPVSKLIKINLGDALLIHCRHCERHIQQMLELLAHRPA